MTLVPSNENRNTLNKYEELQTNIRHLIRSKTINSDDYYEKYMKIKFNSDDDLPLQKTLELCNIIIVRDVFHEEFFR